MTNVTIVGAGLAGLIAAHAWPSAAILEAAARPAPLHRALLRFRSDSVARLTGIEFRRVLVRKGIWSGGRFVEPNPRVANLYSRKVLGRVAGDRSIWNIQPVERFIAPQSFYPQLIEQVGDRIAWGVKADFRALSRAHRNGGGSPVISTAPLPTTLMATGVALGGEFHRSAIKVERWHLPDSDVHQTVYFPNHNTSLYRASLTGSTLILEYAQRDCLPDNADYHLVDEALGIDMLGCTFEESVQQSYGKIQPIDAAQRKRLLFELTHEHGIYSLGRFATWRNLLLDDVVDDISVIKRLMRSGAAYDLRRATA